MQPDPAVYATVLFVFDRPLEDDTKDAVLNACLMAQRPETVRALLAASEHDIQSELDFVEQHVRGNVAAQCVYGAFIDQLECPGGCEAVLAGLEGVSGEDRALLLDHYLAAAHRLARGFRNLMRDGGT